MDKKPLSTRERTRYYRIRKKAFKYVKELTELSQDLPEKQLKQIFNVETLKPLIKAIFQVNDKGQQNFESEEQKTRLLLLCYELLLDLENYGYDLCDKTMRAILNQARYHEKSLDTNILIKLCATRAIPKSK